MTRSSILDWQNAASCISRELISCDDSPRSDLLKAASARRRSVAVCALISAFPGTTNPRELSEVATTKLGESAFLVRCLSEAIESGSAISEVQSARLKNPHRLSGDLYESLLYGPSAKASVSRPHRRSAGAYYTPVEFASHAAARALEVIHQKDAGILEKAPPVICDLSCGSGAFLVATITALRDRGLDPDVLDEVIASAWFVDVDPAAIDLTRISLEELRSSPEREMPTLAQNGIHGNPLIRGEGGSELDRREAFLEGFVMHTHLAIPNLPTADLVVGNPPWERLRIEDKSFFEPFDTGVATATTATRRAAARKRALASDSDLAEYFARHVREMDDARDAIRGDERFSNSAKGELLTHALFTELSAAVAGPDGWVGLLVKGTLVSSRAHADLFCQLADSGRIHEVWGFTNSEKYFAIDSRERFAFIIVGPARKQDSIRVATQLRSHEAFSADSLLTNVTAAERRLLNPRFRMLPGWVDSDSMELLIAMSTSGQSLGAALPDAHFGRLVHLTNHRDAISEKQRDKYLPVFEGRMIHQFDGRFAGFDNMRSEVHKAKAAAELSSSKVKLDRTYVPQSRFFVESERWESIAHNYAEPWSIVWRSASSYGNRYPVVATLLPRLPTIQSLQLLQIPGSDPVVMLGLLGLMNSTLFGWSVRMRMGGIDVTSAVISEAAFPPIDRWRKTGLSGPGESSIETQVARLVARLLSDDARLDAITCQLLGRRPEEPGPDLSRRITIRSRIDDLVLLAFGDEVTSSFRALGILNLDTDPVAVRTAESTIDAIVPEPHAESTFSTSTVG